MGRKRAALLLTEGFEEAEAVVIADVLRRNQIDLTVISCTKNLTVTGLWGMRLETDQLLEAIQTQDFDAVILPGGPKAARFLGETQVVLDFVTKHIKAHAYICCLCSAGAHVLAKNNLLGSRHYTCSGDNYTLYEDGIYRGNAVVIDGIFITGKGLGHAFEFAFSVSEYLADPKQCREQADHIYVTYQSPTITHSSVQREWVSSTS